jgi:serralysin
LSALVGDADDMSGHAQGGNDHLTGGPSLANLYGDARTMHDQAIGGDDVLVSTGFTNNLYGDAETLGDNSRGGNDVLIGGHGTDHMWGDAATVAAGALTGADTFVFAPGGGRDDINDFRQSDGDRIDVHAYGFTHLEDMTITGDGHNTTISFDDASSVTLVGFADPHALHLTDFLFA